VKLTRSGLSPDTAISGITVWNGTQRLNVSNILAYGVADINFSNAVVIPANSSVTLSVKVNVDSKKTSATPGSQFAITVDEVKNAATSTLIPATSGIMTVTDVQLGILNVGISGDAPTSTLDVGVEAVPLAKFDFEATGEDLLLKQVGFSQNGNAADADIANLKLFNNAGVQVGSEAIRNGRLVAFTFADGLAIANGETLRLELRGDVVGGSARAVQFGVDDATDIQATGKTYGTTIVSTLSTSKFNGNYTVESGYPLDINPGSFIVSKAETSPVAGDVGYTFKENVFAILRVEAIGEPIQVRTITLAREDIGTSLSQAKLTNLKLLYNGGSIAQVVSPFKDDATKMDVTLTAPITLTPGTPAYISIAADTAATLDSSSQGKTIVLGLAGDAGAIYGLGTVSAKNISSAAIGSPVYGNTMTVGDIKVVAVAVPRGGTNIFQGQVNAELASFNLDHNLGETVSLTKVGIELVAPKESAIAPSGTIGPSSGTFTNLAIYDANGVAISDKISNVDKLTGLTFSLKTPLKIEADQTVKIVLKADVSSNAADRAAYSFKLTDSSYALTTALGTSIPVEPVTAYTIYTVRSGDSVILTAAQSSALDLEAYINASQGATNVAIAAFKLTNDQGIDYAPYLKPDGSKTTNYLQADDGSVLTTAVLWPSDASGPDGANSDGLAKNPTYSLVAVAGFEPIVVKKINLTSTFDSVTSNYSPTGTLGTSHIKNITIVNNYDKSILGKAEYLETSGGITLTAPLVLGNSDSSRNADIIVYADVVSTARRGGTYKVALNGAVEYQTQSTGRSGTETIASLSGSTLVVTPTTVTVTANSVSNISNASGSAQIGHTIGSFTFTNHGNVAVVVDRVNLTNTLGSAWSSATVELVKGATVLGSGAIGSVITIAGTTSATQLRLEAGASVTVTVRVSNAGTVDAETSVALEVLRGAYGSNPNSVGTSFIIPNDASTRYLIEDDAASNVVYYIATT
jgi:hypothetical protein